MKGTLKVNFKQFDEDEVISAGSFTISGINVEYLAKEADEIDEYIMSICHSRALEFTHTFTF